MFKTMDRGGSYEKLSIRDSARSLKKYGSTSKHVTRSENCIKHYVSQTDTLQGIALKYDVTIEKIRRVNRLYASDSLFLKEYLLIPIADQNNVQSPQEPTTSPMSTQMSASISNNSFEDEDNVEDFLGKIDAAIATTKEEVRKTQNNSEFATNLDFEVEKRKHAVSRLKKTSNMNNNGDPFAPPTTVVVQQGRKVKSSVRRQHEQQQDEMFEL